MPPATPGMAEPEQFAAVEIAAPAPGSTEASPGETPGAACQLTAVAAQADAVAEGALKQAAQLTETTQQATEGTASSAACAAVAPTVVAAPAAAVAAESAAAVAQPAAAVAAEATAQLAALLANRPGRPELENLAGVVLGMENTMETAIRPVMAQAEVYAYHLMAEIRNRVGTADMVRLLELILHALLVRDAVADVPVANGDNN